MMAILVLVVLFLLLLFLGIFKTFLIEKSLEQKEFMDGRLPKKLDGFYRGSVGKMKTRWQGKSFRKEDSSGINIVLDGNEIVKKYPFKTYIGRGIRDKKVAVLKIDYDIPKNPWWLRLILDELVEVERNRYLGKVHVKLIPSLPFSLGYFRLEKK